MTITDKPYKVLVPTAGTGSRLGGLTKFLNKSLISIENKPVLSRIIDMFPDNTKFVIVLGHKGDLVKQFISLAYPDRSFEFAEVEKYEGEGSGLGLSILTAEKYLQEPFVFCSCDTIVTGEIPYPDKNIAGYGKRENKNQYRTVEIENGKVKKLLEKNESNNFSEPYIGLSCIKDWKIFWEEMHKGGQEAVNTGESYALKKFAEKGILYAKEFVWLDTGNTDELNKTCRYFKQENSPNILPKPDEAIWFIDDKVIKYSDNKNFIKDRIKRQDYLEGYIPKIEKSAENMYLYKKIDGEILSKISNTDIFKKLLIFSKTFWKEKSLSSGEKKIFYEKCKNFYYSKTVSRIQKYYDTFGIKDCEYTINGKKYPLLTDILDKIDRENLYNGLAGRFHGDFHFENILYNEKKDNFIFFDWRQNFDGLYEYGDIYYDLAKLLHGLIICHELIAKNHYSARIDGNIVNYSFERKPILEECEKYYYNWLEENGYDVRKVKILTALIYLNIAALHHYPYCHLLYFLGKTMLYENI